MGHASATDVALRQVGEEFRRASMKGMGVRVRDAG